jgi:hypothetical protein
MFCSNCASKIEENARFCTRCGTAITALPKSSDTPPPSTTIQVTPTISEPEQPIAATPSSVPSQKIITLPSGRKIKVKPSAPPTPPKEYPPLTNLWVWLLATVPPFIWLILLCLTESWGLACAGAGILTVVFALKDENALRKAGCIKEASDFRLALCIYPVFYLFSRASRTNKNYGPAALSSLLLIIDIIICCTIVQSIFSDIVNDRKNRSIKEEMTELSITEKAPITFADGDELLEFLIKSASHIELVQKGIMTKREFEAEWGISPSEAIEVINDLERDSNRLNVGLMTEEEFEAKWTKTN